MIQIQLLGSIRDLMDYISYRIQESIVLIYAGSGPQRRGPSSQGTVQLTKINHQQKEKETNQNQTLRL